MRILVLLGVAAVLANCSPADEPTDKNESTPTASASPPSVAKSDAIEIRFSVPKAALPAALTTDPVQGAKSTRVEITGDDLGKLTAVVPGIARPGTLGPKCFRVCEQDCHGIGENQVCTPRCHIECID